MPSDGRPDELTAPQLQGARNVIVKPIKIINCPSRRSNGDQTWPAGNAINAEPFSDGAGKGDYALGSRNGQEPAVEVK